jgi:hypothetical protein
MGSNQKTVLVSHLSVFKTIEISGNILLLWSDFNLNVFKSISFIESPEENSCFGNDLEFKNSFRNSVPFKVC